MQAIESRCTSLARYHAFICMAIIHTAKKEAGKDCRVFGLGTDGHDFNFMAIDENFRYHMLWKNWVVYSDQIDIVALISRVFKHIVQLPCSAIKTEADARARNAKCWQEPEENDSEDSGSEPSDSWSDDDDDECLTTKEHKLLMGLLYQLLAISVAEVSSSLNLDQSRKYLLGQLCQVGTHQDTGLY